MASKTKAALEAELKAANEELAQLKASPEGSANADLAQLKSELDASQKECEQLKGLVDELQQQQAVQPAAPSAHLKGGCHSVQLRKPRKVGDCQCDAGHELARLEMAEDVSPNFVARAMVDDLVQVVKLDA